MKGSMKMKTVKRKNKQRQTAASLSPQRQHRHRGKREGSHTVLSSLQRPGEDREGRGAACGTKFKNQWRVPDSHPSLGRHWTEAFKAVTVLT